MQKEKSLISLMDNEPVTTSLIIAKGVDIEHRAILKLIKKYEPKFKKIGGKTLFVN